MKTINRIDLLNNLTLVKSGLSAREFIEQSSCFVFEDGWVMTFNDEIACRKRIEGLNITGAVQAAAFMDIIAKLTDDELEIVDGGKGELVFQGKRKRFGLVMEEKVFLPISRVEKPEKWRPIPPEFTQAIGLVSHCVSTDQSRFVLTCIHIHPDFVEACDNHQLMRCKVETGVKESILVRGTSLEPLLQLGMEKMAETDSWLHFKNAEGLIYSCRRYIEDYPMLDQLFRVKGNTITLPKGKGLVDATDRAAVFALEKVGSALLTVQLKPGMIQIAGQGLSGWYKERRALAYTGPELEFLIAPHLLRHISDKYEEAVVSETKMKAKGGAWQYITVLGSPKDTEAEEPADEDAEE